MSFFGVQKPLTPEEKYKREVSNEKNLFTASILLNNWGAYNNNLKATFRGISAIFHSEEYEDDQFDYMIDGVYFKKVFECHPTVATKIKIFDTKEGYIQYIDSK